MKINYNLLNIKIPEIETLEMWEKYNYIDSPFVEIPQTIKCGEETKIIVDMQYLKLNKNNAINRCLIRKEALERLLIASLDLPEGLAFKVWDVYRTWNLQNELYYDYKPIIIKKFNLQGLSLKQQEKVISNYISIPSKNNILAPLHTTGGAIDLTLTDLVTKTDLDFGIGFDEFSNLTNTASYEKENLDINIRNNRRLLYNIMIKSGFTNLPSEVWHYDYGNRAWGYYKKKPAIYNGVMDINEISSIISFKEFLANFQDDKSDMSIKLKKYTWK